MDEFLHSPFAIGFCVVVLLAWVLMLVAIFRPGKPGKDGEDDRLRF